VRAPTAISTRRGKAVASAATVLALAALISTGHAAGASPAHAAAPAACSASGFCDDFESQTGTQPSGRWSTAVADCSGTGTTSVDSSVAHSGSRSIRVDGKAGYCNHAFAGASLSGLGIGSQLYVRFWLRHSTPLPQGHVAFAAMQDPHDNNTDLRMGGQNSALQWNRESDDATLPAQSPVGISKSIPLPVNTWTCVEYKVDSAGKLDTWVNGTEVLGLVADGVSTPDVDQQWNTRTTWKPAPTDLRLGWESYWEGDDTLWFDDVAVGNARVGC
jgi:hypothetical protein